MKQNTTLFLFYILFLQINSLTIHYIGGSSLKDCRIKFHTFPWQEIDNCDKTEFDTGWSGGEASVNNIHIDYNLGDMIYIIIKAFNNVPYQQEYEDYCSIYMHLRVNEYYFNNNRDVIYYCSNCGCTESLGDKTFCHKWGDKRLYCDPVRGKEYYFFIRISGYHELDLMDTYTTMDNYYKITGNDYYLSETQDTQEIKFSSDSILVSSYDPRHKVILDELSIKYSFEGLGEFTTINGEILSSSGELGSDIIFIKPINISGNETFHTKFFAQTVSKFGNHKGSSTSNTAEFNLYYCAPGFKMSENGTCYKCFESCFNCSEPGDNITHHCDKCNHFNLYYFYLNDTKNCNPSCKSANKVRSGKSKYNCIDKDECEYYISSDEESCVESCLTENEYYDNRTGNLSQICLNHCDEYISNNHTTCLDSCQRMDQLMDNINLNNKICLTEDLCIQYEKFIDSNKTSCNQNCFSISELQDYRNNEYNPYCLSYNECDRYISYNEEKCVNDCPNELEYFDDRGGNRSKHCLKKEECDSYISSNDTICLDECKIINELTDQLIDNIDSNKKCMTEDLCIQYKKFIDSNKTSCIHNCDSVSEFQDLRNNEYNPYCLAYNECNRYITYNEEKCVNDCPNENEYYDDRSGNRSKKCLKKEECDSYISSNDTICLDECKRIGELANQLIDSINLNNKICLTEDLCIKYEKFIDSNKTSCNQNCFSISELQDYRNNEYNPYCLSYNECDRYISYNEEKCVNDCPNELEYFDDRSGNRSKHCLKKEECDSWISSNDTICLDDCKTINELSDLNSSHLCVQFCHSDLFFTPELMICDTQCKDPYIFFIKYENKTKKCVKNCEEFPYIVLDEENSECLIFNKFEIISIQMNPSINSNKEKFPTYFVYKPIKNITIKVTFNQNIRKRVKLLGGSYQKNLENNNSIIIKIEELKEKHIFNFSDSLNDTYYFGFEIDLISSIDILLIILIIISCVLLILLIISLIFYHKKKKKFSSNIENSYIELKNNSINNN